MQRFIFLISGMFLLLLCTSSVAVAQQGCTDPAAVNYNASATQNDGSCTYTPVFYNPPAKVDPMDDLLFENSGLVWAGNHLWTFNDGGGAAAIYRIDTITKTIFQTVHLQGATNTDWEDIAFDGTFFYVGDFGNNLNGARTDLKIYKFRLSDIPDHTTDAVFTLTSDKIEAIVFAYEDQPQPPTPQNNVFLIKYDCEAMIAENGKIFLFTKNWAENNTSQYEITGNATDGYTAKKMGTLPTGYLVTAADKVPGKKIVALLGYSSQNGEHYMHLLTDYAGNDFFSGNKRTINLGSALSMGQAEGICFRNDVYGYISNERVSAGITIPQRLKSFNVSDFVPASVLSLGLVNFHINNQGGLHKLTWQFTEATELTELQYSTDGRNFSAIQQFAKSKTGSFIARPTAASNFYRLSWQTHNGDFRFSPVINATENIRTHQFNLNLSASGGLSFTVPGTSGTPVSITLLATDGRVLQMIPAQTYLPGINRVPVQAGLHAGNVVIVRLLHYGGQVSMAVPVSD